MDHPAAGLSQNGGHQIDGRRAADSGGVAMLKDVIPQDIAVSGARRLQPFQVRISQSGCMDLCAQGPNIMIFPDNVWFKNVQSNDLPDLCRRYLDPLKEQPRLV